MSARPILTKKANKLRKLMRQSPETSIDLVQWLKDRRYAKTTGEAEEIILAGRVRSESHVLGTTMARMPKKDAKIKVLMGRELTDDDFENRKVVRRLVSSKFRPTLYVREAA